MRLMKQGDSSVLGYVLLIVLAVGMAAAVYAYLKFYVPKDQPQCPEGVSLAISNVSCASGSLTITLVNTGLFSLNGSYIKVGNKSRTFKTTVNCPGQNPWPPECQLYFNDGPPSYLTRALKPGERWTRSFSYVETGLQEIEVEPLVVVPGVTAAANRSRVLCKNAVVVRDVACS